MVTDHAGGPEPARDEIYPAPILHPALLALYPVLGLYAHNATKIPLAAVVRPALFLIAGAAVLTMVLGRVYGHRYKGGLAASVLMISAFSGWSIFSLFMNISIPYVTGYSNWVYYIVYCALLAGLVALVYRWSSIRQRLSTRWVIILLVLFLGLAVATDGLLAQVYSRGPAWYMAFYVILVFGTLIALGLAQRDFRTATVSANWFGVALLGLSLLNILYNRPQLPALPPLPPIQSAALTEPVSDAEDPDIYFIVAGGHGRADVHQARYGYNETPFIRSMEALGFNYVRNSIANYPNTILSLASCLNMDYLDNLLPAESRAGLDFTLALEYLHHNRVFSYLQQRGYRLLAFSQGTEALEPRGNVDEIIRPRRTLNEFEIVLLNSSAFSSLGEAYHYFVHGSRMNMRHVFERSWAYHVFDRLEKLPSESSNAPRFVYAHVTLPEPPFLFTRDGGWPPSAGTFWYAGRTVFLGDSDDYRAGYREQLTFTNRMLELVANRIIENSDRPAAVIIVSAHGPGSAIAAGGEATLDLRERFSNLKLLRFPHVPSTPISDDLSLANLFRVTFNELFDAGFDLLPNKAYMVDMRDRFTYEAIPSLDE